MELLVIFVSLIGLLAWLAYFPYAVATLYSLKNLSKYEKEYKSGARMYCSKRIIFRFVTKGGHGKLIDRGVHSIINSCSRLGYVNYKIEVVSDDPSDVFDSNATKILTPYWYATRKNTRFKARALNYAIENTDVSENTWILHLDDESKVTEQTIYAILSYLNNDPKIAAEGAINYPHEFGRNYITSLLEGERALSCLFCIEQLDFDPIWLHGSNLLVRSDVEKSIGWDFGPDCIAEDTRFGYEIIKRYGSRAFGWHGGTMLEQPTFTIKDTVRQRQRWFIGAVRNIEYLHTRKHKIVETYFLMTWTLGFFASFLGVFAIFGYLYIPAILKPILTFNLFAWALTYQIGLYLNVRHIRMPISEKLLYHIAAVILLPVLGIASTFPTIYSAIRRPKSFEIVQKNISEVHA